MVSVWRYIVKMFIMYIVKIESLVYKIDILKLWFFLLEKI